jgi:hypothetical protein
MTEFTNFAKNWLCVFWKIFERKKSPKQFVEGASLGVTVPLGTSLPYIHQVP